MQDKADKTAHRAVERARVATNEAVGFGAFTHAEQVQLEWMRALALTQLAIVEALDNLASAIRGE